MNDQGQVDAKEMAKRVEEKRKRLPLFSDACSIYRVPQTYKNSDEKPCPYTPQFVSIGPYHHGKKELEAMEEHKTWYMHDFLELSSANLEDIITCINQNERRIRNSYAEAIHMESEKFVNMILVDATFLISLLLKNYCRRLTKSNDRIFNKPKMINYLREDLIMLENQLPFFILSDLYNLSNLASHLEVDYGWPVSIIELTKFLLSGTWGNWMTEKNLKEKDYSKAEHFLDFCKICQQPQKPKLKREAINLVMPTVTELHNAGVKFELHLSENKMDIEFDKKLGILKIPHFEISNTAEIMVRNVVVFENCHYEVREKYVNDYIFLLYMLIKYEKDVEILDQSGIIKNWKGNNQAFATALSNMETYVSSDKFFYHEMLEDLNAYYKNSWHKWKANLKHNYFNTPWAGISVAAAAFLIILTIIQTVCSILQVK